MNTKNKSSIVAIILILLGVLFLGASWQINKREFKNFSTSNYSYEEKTYVCKSDVDKIVVSDSSNDVFIGTVSGIDKVKVTYFENEEDLKYEISEKKGTFKIGRKSIKHVGVYFGINLSSPSVKVEVPESFMGEVEVECSSGDIIISEIDASRIKITATSGDIQLVNTKSDGEVSCGTTSGSINLKDIKAERIDTSSTSGDISLEEVFAKKSNSDSTSGSHRFLNSQIENIKTTTTSGGVEFDSLKTINLKVGTTSGSVRGDIVGNEDDYSISTNTTSGSSNLKNKNQGKYSIDISTTSGSINIDFE